MSKEKQTDFYNELRNIVLVDMVSYPNKYHEQTYTSVDITIAKQAGYNLAIGGYGILPDNIEREDPKLPSRELYEKAIAEVNDSFPGLFNEMEILHSSYDHVVLAEKNTSNIYVLVRGTVLGENYGSLVRDLKQDVEIAWDSSKAPSRAIVIADIIKDLELPDNSNLVFLGHSLGGSICEHMATMFNHSKVTVYNPGRSRIPGINEGEYVTLKQLFKKGIISSLSNPNCVEERYNLTEHSTENDWLNNIFSKKGIPNTKNYNRYNPTYDGFIIDLEFRNHAITNHTDRIINYLGINHPDIYDLVQKINLLRNSLDNHDDGSQIELYEKVLFLKFMDMKKYYRNLQELDNITKELESDNLPINKALNLQKRYDTIKNSVEIYNLETEIYRNTKIIDSENLPVNKALNILERNKKLMKRLEKLKNDNKNTLKEAPKKLIKKEKPSQYKSLVYNFDYNKAIYQIAKFISGDYLGAVGSIITNTNVSVANYLSIGNGYYTPVFEGDNGEDVIKVAVISFLVDQYGQLFLGKECGELNYEIMTKLKNFVLGSESWRNPLVLNSYKTNKNNLGNVSFVFNEIERGILPSTACKITGGLCGNNYINKVDLTVSLGKGIHFWNKKINSDIENYYLLSDDEIQKQYPVLAAYGIKSDDYLIKYDLDKIRLSDGRYLIDQIENDIDNGNQYVDRKDKEFFEKCDQIIEKTKDNLENIVNDHNDNIVLKNKEYQNNLNSIRLKLLLEKVNQTMNPILIENSVKVLLDINNKQNYYYDKLFNPANLEYYHLDKISYDLLVESRETKILESFVENSQNDITAWFKILDENFEKQINNLNVRNKKALEDEIKQVYRHNLEMYVYGIDGVKGSDPISDAYRKIDDNLDNEFGKNLPEKINEVKNRIKYIEENSWKLGRPIILSGPRKKLSRLEEANREKELKRSIEYKKLDEVFDSLMPKIEIMEIDTNKISTDKPKRESGTVIIKNILLNKLYWKYRGYACLENAAYKAIDIQTPFLIIAQNIDLNRDVPDNLTSFYQNLQNISQRYVYTYLAGLKNFIERSLYNELFITLGAGLGYDILQPVSISNTLYNSYIDINNPYSTNFRMLQYFDRGEIFDNSYTDNKYIRFWTKVTSAVAINTIDRSNNTTVKLAACFGKIVASGCSIFKKLKLNEYKLNLATFMFTLNDLVILFNEVPQFCRLGYRYLYCDSEQERNMTLENTNRNPSQNIRIKNTIDSRFDDPEFVNQLLAELPGEIIHKSDTLNIEKMSKIQTAKEIISAGATVTLCGAVLVALWPATLLVAAAKGANYIIESLGEED